MKTTKRRLEILSFYDYTRVTAHLEGMAQKGWALERISNSVWRYRRIEPKKLRYAVVYLPTSSEFDPEPTEDARRFQEFCAQAGWVQVANLAQMHIFVNEKPDPVPIETDPVVQIDTIHAAMKKNHLPSQILLLVIACLQLAMQAGQIRQWPLEMLSRYTTFVGLVCWTLILLMSAGEMLSYFRWRSKALEAAQDGEFLPTRGTHILQSVSLWILAALMVGWAVQLNGTGEWFPVALCFGLMGLVLAAVFAVKALCKRLGVSAGAAQWAVWATSIFMTFAYIVILLTASISASDEGWFRDEDTETYQYNGSTFEVHHDSLPLTVQDLMDTDYDAYSTKLEKDATPLLSRAEASQRPRMDALGEPELCYEIYDPHLPILEEALFQALKQERERYDENQYRPIELDGVEAWQLFLEDDAMDIYLLRWPGRFVYLDPDWALTEDQLLTTARILAP